MARPVPNLDRYIFTVHAYHHHQLRNEQFVANRLASYIRVCGPFFFQIECAIKRVRFTPVTTSATVICSTAQSRSRIGEATLICRPKSADTRRITRSAISLARLTRLIEGHVFVRSEIPRTIHTRGLSPEILSHNLGARDACVFDYDSAKVQIRPPSL